MSLDSIDASGISGDVTFKPVEALFDPVSKLRVSQPEALIDTDFEYGLQATRWETLELVNNIPTFFARQGDDTLSFGDIQVTSGSKKVTVTTSLPHNLNPGSPIIVIGTTKITCDGTFVVDAVPSTTSFTYRAKDELNITGSVRDTYTEIYPGSVYQGSLFDIDDIVNITTDQAANSQYLVETTYPSGLVAQTSLFMLNSIGTTKFYFDANSEVTVNGYTSIAYNIVANTKSGSGNTDYEWTAIQPVDYKATNTFTFGYYTKAGSNLTMEDFSGTAPAIGQYWLYAKGATSNNVDAAMLDYQVYYISDVTVGGSTVRVNLTGPNNVGGYTNTITFAANGSANVSAHPHAFFRVYPLTAANTTTGIDSVTTATDFGWSALQNNPVVFVGHTSGTGNTSNYFRSRNNRAIADYKIYYSKQRLSAYQFNYAASSGGAIINLNGNNVSGGFLMPITTIASKNTIRYANHGFTDNDIVTLTKGTGSNNIPQTLAPFTNYVIRKYDNDRFKLLSISTGNDVEIQDVGDANLVFSSKRTEANNESIQYANHGMTDGTAVIYTAEGNTVIGGLSNGFTYYVFASTTDRFKLANTANGYSTANQTIVQNTTFVNVSATANVFLANLHGYTTGKGIKYTASVPIGGLKSGQHYFVRADTTNTFTLYWSSAGASAANTADVVPIGYPLTGNGVFIQAEMFDLTSAGQGSQLFTNETVGSSDGVYTINSVSNSSAFVMYAEKAVFNRVKAFSGNSAVNLTNSAIFIPDHRMRTGTEVTYSTTGTVMGGGLANNVNYYAIKLTNDWLYLSYTKADALLSQNQVSLTTTGSGIHSLSTNSMIGEPLGYGTINLTANTKTVTGNGTNFTAYYKKGSSIKIYYPGTSATLTCTDANTTNGTFIVNAAHNMSIDGTAIKFNTNTSVGVQTNTFYYVNVSNTVTPTNQFKIYNTYFDAINPDGGGIVVPATGGAGISITANAFFTLGNTFSTTVNAVYSKTSMLVDNFAPANGTSLSYSIKTQLYLRADGFALHRPYDGGVELIPSTNPSSTMIRQTRKYFRYQSGKGIQVSLAINFSPSTVIDSMTRTAYSGGTATGTIFTRNPHRLSVGTQITIFGATDSGWNQSRTVASVTDPYTFTYSLNQSGGPSGTTTAGRLHYYVNSWNNCALRLGLFDDQNGLYWEYDGSTLYACRKTSTNQLSGTATVSFKSGLVTGSGTLYSSQLSAGEYVVIKGQSYKVLQVNSDTSFNISPFYRGTSASNIIVTATEVTRTAQSSWSIDPCDGTGPTGYNLDIHKIQMAYIDYSWYGAGKVRYGFKDTEGRVQYVHEFVHNNQKTEAYLRSGNLPCRYEISSTGVPSYVPALAHWGTSVIMDGRYDDDKAYLFTASGNQLTFTGNSSITFNGYIEGTSQRYISNNGLLTVGYAVTVSTPSPTLSSVAAGLPIAGNNIPTGTRTSLPSSNRVVPYQPYLPSYPIRYANGVAIGFRTLMIIDSLPTAAATSGQASQYTITAGQDSLVYDIPLISIRLSPSVDSSTIGNLGEREIINRMQLILSSVNILTTHSVEVSLVLNSRIDSSNWVRVNPPSLSQVIYHDSLNSSTSGVKVYSFRAQGSSGNTARTQTGTSLTLGEVATLGNAILGGDNAYPDGPDVLTITARLVEDPSTVTATNPFQITGRISWTESQA